MDRLEVGRDAWTYHEFGARSFQDDIRALVINDLDQSPDRDGISTYLREQATARPFPLVPVPLKRVTLEPETIDPHGVGGVPQLLLTVELDHYADTFAYLLDRPELLAKISNRVTREIAADLLASVFGVGDRNDAVTVSAELAEILDCPRQHGEAVRLDSGDRISFDFPSRW